MPAICHLGKFDEIIKKTMQCITLRNYQVTLQPVFKDKLTSQGPEENANDSPCFAKSLSGCVYQSVLRLKARKQLYLSFSSLLKWRDRTPWQRADGHFLRPSSMENNWALGEPRAVILIREAAFIMAFCIWCFHFQYMHWIVSLF